MELSSQQQQQQQQLGYSSRHHEVGEGSSMMMSDDFREHMFDKVVTPSDVGKLNRLVIPKQYAEKYFPLDSSSNEKGLLLNFEDKGGKAWRFRYSYWNSSQSYVMTKGWSRFVKEKQLNAGDIVSFHRGTCSSSSLLEDYKYYIDWRRRMPPPPPPLAPPDQYYYPNHQTCSILQVQHGSAAAWFGTAGPPSFQHVLARPQYHLPLPNLHCFTRDHHPHLSQMQMMTATTTASALKTTASNFGDHNNMYVHHPIPIPTPSSSSSSSSYSGGATNRQYYHASMSSTSTNPTSMVVHHGSVVYVRPIGGAQGSGMQTPQVQMPMRQDPVVGPHLEGNPMLFQSLPPPVVQCGNKAPKRLRLFGVNMDCPAAEGDADEDDDVDNHAPDFYAADHNIFPILSMPPNNMDDHHINSSPHIQSPCLYAGVYPPPTTNPNSPTTSIVNDSIFDKGNSSMS